MIWRQPKPEKNLSARLAHTIGKTARPCGQPPAEAKTRLDEQSPILAKHMLAQGFESFSIRHTN